MPHEWCLLHNYTNVSAHKLEQQTSKSVHSLLQSNCPGNRSRQQKYPVSELHWVDDSSHGVHALWITHWQMLELKTLQRWSQFGGAAEIVNQLSVSVFHWDLSLASRDCWNASWKQWTPANKSKDIKKLNPRKTCKVFCITTQYRYMYNNNNNEYLEHLTHTGAKRLHILFKYILSKFNVYNMNAHARTHTHTHQSHIRAMRLKRFLKRERFSRKI